MNKLTFKVMNPQPNTWVSFDNQDVRATKDNGGHNVYTIETEKSKIDVTLYKYLEVNSPLYIFWQILFFVLSVWGIFNKRLDKKCVVLKYRATINLENNDTTVIARINTNYKETKALNIETETEFTEQENTREVDKNAKKRLKVLKIIKIILWIALIAGFVLWVMNR